MGVLGYLSVGVPRYLAVAVLAVLVVSACSTAGSSGSASAGAPSAGAPSSEPIRIGVTAPLSGGSAEPGQDLVNAAKVAAQHANDAGGVLGRQIEIVAADDQCDAQVGVQAAQKLLTERVVALVGGYCSSAMIPESDVFRENGNIPVIACCASSPQLTEQGYDNVFRPQVRDDRTAPVESSFMVEVLKASRVAVLGDNSQFSSSLAKFTTPAVEELGGTIVYNDAITPGQQDYTSALTRIATTDPDILYYTGFYVEATLLVKQRADLGHDYLFMGSSATKTDTLIEAAGPAAEGTYTTFPPTLETLSGAEVDKFTADYQALSGKAPGPVSVYEYDSINILLAAIKLANSTEPAALNKALHEVSVDGITGTHQFDEKGDTKVIPLVAYIVRDGKYEVFAEFEAGKWVMN